jgi:ComF family protein
MKREAQSSGLLVSLWSAALDLIFPPCCEGCGRVGYRWCNRCADDLLNLPLLNESPGAVKPLQAIAATGIHEGKLQQAVHALKYNGLKEIADPLATRMIAQLQRLNWSFDLIVPVPLHTDRQQFRGYNQSQLLAHAIGAQLVIPCEVTAMTRMRNTRAQVGLNRAERRINMQKAFQGNPALLTGKKVLLVDDVYTTGATLGACAQSALQAGTLAVYALTVTAAA